MRRPLAGLVALLLLVPGVVVAQHVHGETPQVSAQEPGGTASAPPAPLPAFIPALTDADRVAAFPDVGDHKPHGTSTHFLLLADHLEWQADGSRGALAVDATGWVGGDLDRLWFRTHGTGSDGRLDDGAVELFYGRAFARWWDVVAGVRQDVEPGPARSWAAIGIQGLAPYWFEVEATGYVGASGRTRLHLAADYELLLTNRLVLQPELAVDVVGKADPERGLGAGLSTVETALRLRYEIRRELAPYVGIVWQRRTFGTADLARVNGEKVGETRVVIGARLWF